MIRIIPRLDIKGPNLVKGIHLEGLRVLGRPESFAQYYYENGADEIFIQDVVASLFGRNSLHGIISKMAKNVFIPITVGGGIRTIEDIKNVLRAGADKVCLNTAAIRNPQIIKEAVQIFGSSTIVVAIEAIKQKDNSYLAFIDNGREYTGKDVFQWIEQVQELGAGEIILTSVDQEGTGEGYDLGLIKKVCSQIKIPLIAHGGASTKENMCEAINKGADGLAIASVLHYQIAEELNFISEKPEEGNLTFLESKQNRKINKISIEEIKTHLIEREIPCRPL